MINIHPILDGTRLLWYQTIAWVDLNIQTGFLIPTEIGTAYDVGLRPHQSRLSRMGNRSCTHDNWNGVVFDFPAENLELTEEHRDYSSTYPQAVDWVSNRIYPTGKDGAFYDVDILFPSSGSGIIFLPNATKKTRFTGTLVYSDSYFRYEWNSVRSVTIHWYQHFEKTRSGITTNYWWIRSNRLDWLDPLGPSTGNQYKYYQATTPQSTICYPAEPDTLSYVGQYSFGPITFTGLPDQSLPSEITKGDLTLASNWLRDYIPPDDENVWGDLCQVAVQDASAVDINSIAYIKELFEMKDSILATAKLLRGKITSKSLGKLFLGARYGLNLTKKDTEELATALSKAAGQWTHAWRYVRSASTRAFIINSGLLQSCSVAQEYHYKVYYDPLDRGFVRLIQKLMDWDVFPTFQNIWDLIPFSFVLDWFWDFENYFDIVDTSRYATWMDVLEVIATTKTTFYQVPLLDFLPIQKQGRILIGNVDYTRYERAIKPYLTIPRLRVDSTEEFHNFAELTAIVLSQLGK